MDYSLPLSLRKKLKQMEVYPPYAEAYTSDMSPSFFTELRNRTRLEKNTILEVVGETGSGKTYASATIASFLQSCFQPPKLLTIENFCFTNTEFIERAQSFMRHNTILKDEQPRQVFGEGASLEQVSLQDIEEVVRKAQLNMVFISPSTRAFHTGLHYILQTFDLNYEKRECLLLLHEPNDTGLTKPFGSITIKHPSDAYPYLKPIMEAYEAQKDAFIIDATNQTSRAQFFRNLKEKADTLTKDSGFMEIKGFENKLAYVYKYYPDLSSQLSISLLETLIRMATL